MKSDAALKKLPVTPAEWEAVIAVAPGHDHKLTPEEEAKMADAVVIMDGGYAAVRAAMAEKRKPTSARNSLPYIYITLPRRLFK